MANPNASTPLTGFGLTLKEPKLYDVLMQLKSQILIGLNCVKVGSIVKFYPSTKTADIQILFQRVMKNGNVVSYPKLLNCPVVTLQGGGASIQFPISTGDTCVVLFSDRNIDNWYLNGNEQPPIDGRLHDLSDGIALVGINWQADATIPPISITEARIILDDGTTKVGLESGKITVQNASQNLGTILTGLTTALQTLNSAIAAMTTASIAGGVPQAVAAGQTATIAALIADLAALLY